MKSSRTWIPLILMLLATGAVAKAPPDSGLTRRLDELYETFFQKDGVGCAVLIAQNGKVLYEKAFGMADLENSTPASIDSVFRIGSITKQFTAVAILQLQEQGKLDLSDEIQKYVADFPRHADRITIGNLLSHTSGIPNLTEIPGLSIKQAVYTPAELIALFKDRPLEFRPGSKFSYSNSGYVLLGYVIEKASGESYADYVESHIFNKLGMSNSLYDDPARIVKHRARGYELDGNFRLVNAEYLNTTFPYAAGGLAMTVRDYFTWQQGLKAGRLISAESLRNAVAPFRLNDGSLSNYGYGWGIAKVYGSEAIAHGGRINGFNAKETYLPREDILVVTFSNGGFVNTDIINDQAAAIAADKVEFREVEIPASRRKSMVGTYKFPSDDVTTISIFEKAGHLFLKDSNSPTAWKMHFTKDDEFICYEVFPNTHVFVRNNQGAVEALLIRNFGNEVTVKKVE